MFVSSLFLVLMDWENDKYKHNITLPGISSMSALCPFPCCRLLFPFPSNQGFGFLGFIVDDLDGASDCLKERGATEIPEPAIFKGKLRRFTDPDGYHVQLALRQAVLE